MRELLRGKHLRKLRAQHNGALINCLETGDWDRNDLSLAGTNGQGVLRASIKTRIEAAIAAE